MKRNELVDVTKYLNQFKKISSIKRVEDTTIKIAFDRNKYIYFDLKRGDSHIFMKENYKRAKIYSAPFDVLLYKRFAGAHIDKCEVVEKNRVLRIYTTSNSSYKASSSVLQLEFTGRNTNCIIVDEEETILEALRHIDSGVSSRAIKVGERLEELESRVFEEKPSSVGEDVEAYLQNEYQVRSEKRLMQLKNQKLISLQKRIDKLQSILDRLDDEDILEVESKKYNEWGTLVLSNLYQIEAYQKEVTLFDFEGKEVRIKFPKEARTPSEAANILFNQSKKLKKKAKSLHIEREGLEEKIEFQKRVQNVVKKSNDETELNIIMPKQKKMKKSKNEQKNYETFFIDGFKIMLGKNEKGNITLLKEAKKRDIWLHLKDIPLAHVIIKTDKQSIPGEIIDFAAKLCVELSVTKKGTYLVDYTQRRNVKVIDGANVNYVDYKTLHFEE